MASCPKCARVCLLLLVIMQPPITNTPNRLTCPPDSSSGFSLIELMIVVTIIAILAGLTLAAMSGVNQRAARDRAKGEIAAIVNAIESYKMQMGIYPTNMGTAVIYTNISGYLASAKFDTNTSGQILDPYGKEYAYRNPGTVNKASFDVLSYGADGSTGAGKTNDDIGNW